MELVLLISIPITNLITGYLVFKAVQIGLRWNMQLKKDQEPILNNPIKQHFEEKKEVKMEQEVKKEQERFDSEFKAYYGPADILNPNVGGKS
jgi:hypothetical protein